MTQTLAIFTEAVRALRARKMFWIVLLISALVAGAFALVGINEEGVTLLGWQTPLQSLNTNVIPAEMFYKQMFTSLGVGFWLSWIASILALISTAGIVPNFLTKGTIDLALSKPIGRVRLFLTQYAAGLLFVFIQVALFTLASFLVIGIRGGVWLWGLFVAVPIVVCFFSYLYSVCALLGVLMRSTVASLLLTLVFWFLLYSLTATDNVLLQSQYAMEAEAEHGPIAMEVKAMEDRLAMLNRGTTQPGHLAVGAAELRSAESDLEAARSRQQTLRSTALALAKAQRIVRGIRAPLPKTGETIQLLERALVKVADLKAAMDRLDSRPEEERSSLQDAENRLLDEIHSRSPQWVLGTSLAFEAVVLALATFLFYRKDF